MEIFPSEPKALYRRALARENLNKLGMALEDAKKALAIQPNDRYFKTLYLTFLDLLTNCVKGFIYRMVNFLKKYKVLITK